MGEMTEIVSGKFENKLLTNELVEHPLRNYCPPNLTDIEQYVRGETLELYCKPEIVYIQSFLRMRKSRLRFYRLTLMRRRNNVLCLLAFFLRIWRFKTRQCKKNNFAKKREILFKWISLFGVRRHLLVLERAIYKKKLCRYYMLIKAQYNYQRRLFREALEFCKNIDVRMQVITLRILIARSHYERFLVKHLKALPETGYLGLNELATDIAFSFRYYGDYFGQLLNYYESIIANLRFSVEENIVRTDFARMRELFAERLEKAARRNELIRQSNIIELMFVAWKDASINRHFLLGKYLFAWKRSVFHSESGIKKMLSTKLKTRCLEKWIIFKNTAFLYKQMGYLVLRRSLNIRFLFAAITDCCCGLTAVNNGEFIRNETLALSPEYLNSDARKQQLKTKFILLLRREVEQRRSFYRLVLLCNIFQHYSQILLAFKLLSVKVASISEYRVLELNNKHIFVRQTCEILTDEDMLNIYELAISRNSSEVEEQLLEKYPIFVKKHVEMILNFNMATLEKMVDVWIRQDNILCDVWLFFRVSTVAESELGAICSYNKELKYETRIETYCRTMAENAQQSLLLIKQFDEDERFSKLEFHQVSKFLRERSPVSPFNWLARGREKWLKCHGAMSLRAIFKNNDIFPYVEYFMQQYKATELAFSYETLESEIVRRSEMFYGKTTRKELNEASANFIDRLISEFSVTAERRQWVICNYRRICENKHDITHNELMKNAEALISVSEEEVLFAMYNCKVVQENYNRSYTDLYQELTSRMESETQDSHKAEHDQLRELEEELREQLKQEKIAKEAARKKLAAKAIGRSVGEHGQRKHNELQRFVTRKLKRSRRDVVLAEAINKAFKKSKISRNEAFSPPRSLSKLPEHPKSTFSSNILANGVKTTNEVNSARKPLLPPFSSGRTAKNRNSKNILVESGLPRKVSKQKIKGSISYSLEQVQHTKRETGLPKQSESYCDIIEDDECSLALSDAYEQIGNEIASIESIHSTQNNLVIGNIPIAGVLPNESNTLPESSKRELAGFERDKMAAGETQQGKIEGQQVSAQENEKTIKQLPESVRKLQHIERSTGSEETAINTTVKEDTYKQLIAGELQDEYEAKLFKQPNAQINECLQELIDSKALPAILGNPYEEQSLDGPQSSVFEQATQPSRLQSVVDKITDPEIKKMVEHMLSAPAEFMRDSTYDSELKNMLTYLAFSDISANELLAATPVISASERVALDGVFSGGMRSELYSLIKLSFLGVDSAEITSQPRANQSLENNLPVANVWQEQTEFPVVVKSFGALFREIDMLSDAIFDTANIKIRERLKRDIEPVYVRFLRSRMTRCWPSSPISCNSYRMVCQRPCVLNRQHKRFSLPPASWSVKQSGWSAVGMTVRTLRQPFQFLSGNDLNITEADLCELANFEISQDGENVDRYKAHHGPGSRVE